MLASHCGDVIFDSRVDSCLALRLRFPAVDRERLILKKEGAMRRHVKALWCVLAVILCVGMANSAWAHVTVQATGTHRQVNMITTTPGSVQPPCPAGPPCSTFLGTVIWPQVDQFRIPPNPFVPDPLTVWNHDNDATFTHRTYGGAVIGPGASVSISAISIGEGSQAGKLNSSLAYLPPDTAFAGVGLYGPGPTDSMLIVVVDRTTSSTNVGISIPTTSALQVRSLGNSHEQPKAKFKMLVYEDEATANADANRTGATAKFNGTVILDGNAGTLTTLQGFAPGDWVLISNGSGKYTARPKAGLVKTVPVLNSSNAAVVLVADPVIADPTPGTSPAILVLIALALGAAGVWTMRKRSGPILA
jgi:hypothetical protein